MPRPWTVLPHDPIEKLAPNLWTVEGDLPQPGPVRRRMTVIKRAGGGLLIHNAIPLEPRAQAELEAFGTPEILIVPNGYHRLDAAPYKMRYPQLRVFCPKESDARVRRVVTVDAHYDAFPQDDTVRLIPLVGVKNGEAMFRVNSPDGVTYVFNDALFNILEVWGVQGLVLRLLGSSGGLKVTFVGRMLMVRDLTALKGQLAELARDPNLRRLVVSHGSTVTADAGAALAAAAAR